MGKGTAVSKNKDSRIPKKKIKIKIPLKPELHQHAATSLLSISGIVAWTRQQHSDTCLTSAECANPSEVNEALQTQP